MMWREYRLFRRTLFVSGPPRSGTKTAAQSLNLHPRIWTAIDDHVFESWALYYYRTREGLVERLRRQGIGQREARKILANHLVRRRKLVGIAPSPKAAAYPRAELPARPDSATVPLDSRLLRYQVPLNRLGRGHYLCLKSPEISFVLPQMAKIFPRAKFVLVYRPLLETAESMHRRGHAVRDFPVYHRRWREETDEKGEPVMPPGVPAKWSGLWGSVSDFGRCLIYAASYLEAMTAGLREIPPGRRFVYNHADLRADPELVFSRLARFLDIERAGFDAAVHEIRTNPPLIQPNLREEFDALAARLDIPRLTKQVELFDILKHTEGREESP
jgi:Sulfotransferase family